MTHRLLLLLHSPIPSTKPFSHYSLTPNPNPNPLHHRFFSPSPPPHHRHRPIRLPLTRSRSRSLPPRHFCHPPPPGLASRAHQLLLLLCFAAVLLALRLASAVLLPDFPARWRRLVSSSADAEDAARAYPAHLWHAVVACEDRRFFAHFGVDPVGVARAVASLSARGGGSTITQQVSSRTQPV